MIHSEKDSLTGYLMVALPGLKSEDFQETVLLICQHDASGAMGLVMNQPINGIYLSDFIPDLSKESEEDAEQDSQIFWGGPINVNQGLIVHSSDFYWSSTLPINSDLSLTPHLDVLESCMIQGIPLPQKYRAMLGHVSWKAGQLEKEWEQHAWISFPYREGFVFDIDPDQQWHTILADCGIHSTRLSPHQGRV